MSLNHSSEDLRAELKALADSLEAVLNDTGEKSKEEMYFTHLVLSSAKPPKGSLNKLKKLRVAQTTMSKKIHGLVSVLVLPLV